MVTLAHGRHDHLAAQHRALARGSRRPDHYVVVAMDDPSLGPTDADGLHRSVVRVAREPLGLPLARARNTGVADALGAGVDVVVLLDVDCLPGHDLVTPGFMGVADPDGVMVDRQAGDAAVAHDH